MNPDQQIELYRAARAIAWAYKLEQYDAAALKDMQRIVDKSKASIVQKFADGLGQEGSYTRKHFQNSLKELERLSLGLRNQLGEELTTSTSRIGSLALKEWGENLSVGGVAKKVNTVALSPEQFAAFFKQNPPAGILIPKVVKTALNQGVIGRIEGELLDVLREGALTGQSYTRIVDKLSDSFTDFKRHQLVTLTRTFFQTANAQAFDAVYQANQDIMEGKIWTIVNDDRVCLLCLSLGERLYKKGESHPPMPRHPNCRCVFRAKTVSFRELGIDLDELDPIVQPVVTRGYEKNGKWIIPPVGTGTGHRPRAISFYQGGMKEAFPDLPVAQQKAMLGVGRYNKYKAGELTLDQLADPVSGKLWLLKELDEGAHLRTPDVSATRAVNSILMEGEIITTADLGGGVNVSKVLTIEENGETIKGVFKPIDGEDWAALRGTIINKDMRYAHREVLASELSDKIGFGNVPTTVLREVDGKLGSLQLFVDDAVSFMDVYEDLSISSRFSASDMFETSIFDYLIGNTDRHVGNMLFDSDFRAIAIDNGLSFSQGRNEFTNKVGLMFAKVRYSPTHGGLAPSARAWYTEIPDEVKTRIKTGLELLDIDLITEGYKLAEPELKAFKIRAQFLKDNLDNPDILSHILMYDSDSPAFKILDRR